jgi:hypothetical protein
MAGHQTRAFSGGGGGDLNDFCLQPNKDVRKQLLIW